MPLAACRPRHREIGSPAAFRSRVHSFFRLTYLTFLLPHNSILFVSSQATRRTQTTSRSSDEASIANCGDAIPTPQARAQPH
ncbi:hypothetical protein K402DRAFT_269145 [Aulographum hederae CBS 113979]|uniref:Uncharacterized protein n=1 Tax=Aulographum hederae CBS 113979 TaxID=1176131 RepID=A0A6G1H7T2_9PEZI|nr:hypothetical protein K402DRAFT_269145 [Aulographum hederae CBS 113979]